MRISENQRPNKANKGQILVLVALSLVVFIGFAALAIDVAYFYHTRHQLQGAADAAALAGAAELDANKPPNDQGDARSEAETFAAKNKAAGLDVRIYNNGENTEPFSADNDITIGFWDGSYHTGGTPVNAIHVRARRTSDVPEPILFGGAIGTFFGKIFGVDTVNISADAIASRLPFGTLNLSMCVRACDNTPIFPSISSISPARTIKVGTSSSSPVVPDNQQMAWTNLAKQPSTNTNELKEAICGGPTYRDVCDKELFATMANPSPLLRSLQAAFLNPNYDAAAKKNEFVELTGATQRVWYAVIPILETCAATIQGVENDPKEVVSYAYVRIIGVCPKGGGPDPCAFNLNPLDFQNELSICTNIFDSDSDGKPDYEESVVIDRISCISCNDKFDLIGARAFLVE